MYTYSPRSNPPAFIRKSGQPFSGYPDSGPGSVPSSPNTSRNDAFAPSVIPFDQTRAWLYRSINANTPLPRPLTNDALEQRLLALYDQAKAATSRLKTEDIRAALGKPPLVIQADSSTEAKDRMEYLFSSALPEQLHINPNNPQEVTYYLQFVSRILNIAQGMNTPQPRPQFNLPNSMRSRL